MVSMSANLGETEVLRAMDASPSAQILMGNWHPGITSSLTIVQHGIVLPGAWLNLGGPFLYLEGLGWSDFTDSK